MSNDLPGHFAAQLAATALSQPCSATSISMAEVDRYAPPGSVLLIVRLAVLPAAAQVTRSFVAYCSDRGAVRKRSRTC